MIFKKIKVKVIKSFIDKDNGKVRELNEEFMVSDKRYNEIEKAGHYIKIVAVPKKETKVSDK